MNFPQFQPATPGIMQVHCAIEKLAVFAICSVLLLLNPGHASAGNVEERNKAAARAAFLEYLNRKDFKAFEAAHTRNFVKHYNSNLATETLPQEMEDARGQFVSSSDLTFTINWMIAEGNMVAVSISSKGTHDGPFQGVPPTGKKYEVTAMTVWRFEDGKIAEEWVYWNELDLYRQLGMFKQPETASH